MHYSLSREEFSEVFEKGKRASCGRITLMYTRDNAGSFKFGVAVRKKTAPCVRNKIKRRLRSILLPIFKTAGLGLRLVVSAPPDSDEADFAGLKETVEKALKSAGLT